VLSLTLDAYRNWADPAEAAFLAVARFLRREHLFTARDLPYRTQLPALAAIFVHLGDRWQEPVIYDKIARWYWCGVLGELYGGAVETRIANDVEDMLAWINGGPEPRTVYEAAFQPGRLDTMRSRLSAAYKGLSALVLREGAKDFFWKARIRDLDAEEVALDIHHLFPKDWCEKQGIVPSVYNSIVNKAQISYKANRMIGGHAPSKYLHSLQNHPNIALSAEQMDELLRTHHIEASTMRSDDFDGFFRARKHALLALIETAMGKPVQGRESDEVTEYDAFSEEPTLVLDSGE
jgi:hypothetical protein